MTHDGAAQTVSDACQAYVNTAIAYGRDRKASDAESRFKRYVFDDPIGRVKLSALKPAQVKAWLDLHEFESVGQAQALATEWLWRYNNERPNMAIGGVPPRYLLQTAA